MRAQNAPFTCRIRQKALKNAENTGISYLPDICRTAEIAERRTAQNGARPSARKPTMQVDLCSFFIVLDEYNRLLCSDIWRRDSKRNYKRAVTRCNAYKFAFMPLRYTDIGQNKTRYNMPLKGCSDV